MAVLLAAVLEGLGVVASSLWGLQEQRFTATLESVRYAMLFMSRALVFCFLSLNDHTRAEMSLALI